MGPEIPTKFADLREKKFLVVGATGHVGSKVFVVTRWDDVTQEAFGWMSLQQPAPTPAFNSGVIVGQRMVEMVGNFSRNLKEGRTRLVMGVCAPRDPSFGP